MKKLILVRQQKKASLAESPTFNRNELVGIFASANEGNDAYLSGETNPRKIVSRILETMENLESFYSWSELYDYDHESLIAKLKSLSEEEALELLVRIGQSWLTIYDYLCFVQSAKLGWGNLCMGYATWLALDKNLLVEMLKENSIETHRFYMNRWGEVFVKQPSAGSQYVELNI